MENNSDHKPVNCKSSSGESKDNIATNKSNRSKSNPDKREPRSGPGGE